MSDGIEGAARELGGRAQRTIGAAIGDAKTEATGLYNEAAGRVEQQAGQVADVIREQPLIAAVVALGVGYLIGRLTA